MKVSKNLIWMHLTLKPSNDDDMMDKTEDRTFIDVITYPTILALNGPMGKGQSQKMIEQYIIIENV